MKLLDNISLLNRDTKLLLGFNSVGNLLMVMKGVFIPIYLLHLGFPVILIGTYLMISTFASGITDTGFAILSIKYGRKKVLLFNMFISVFSYLIPLLTKNFSLIIFSAIFSYQGRTNSIADALLADNSTDDERTNLFTVKLFLGSVFSILGPIIAGLPIIFQSYYNFSELTSMMPLFVVGCLLTVISFILVYNLDASRASKTNEKISIPEDQRQIIIKLASTHALDTLAVGITLNIFSLWFTMRYSVDIGVISMVFTFAQISESFAYLLAPYLSMKLGNVKATVIVRAFGATFMFLLAFAPNPFTAAVLYALRNSFQRISHPLRASYQMGILNDNLRATGAGLINGPRMFTMAIGASIGGYLLGISTMLPPIISGTLFGVGDVLYWTFFKNLKPPEEK